MSQHGDPPKSIASRQHTEQASQKALSHYGGSQQGQQENKSPEHVPPPQTGGSRQHTEQVSQKAPSHYGGSQQGEVENISPRHVPPHQTGGSRQHTEQVSQKALSHYGGSQQGQVENNSPGRVPPHQTGGSRQHTEQVSQKALSQYEPSQHGGGAEERKSTQNRHQTPFHEDPEDFPQDYQQGAEEPPYYGAGEEGPFEEEQAPIPGYEQTSPGYAYGGSAAQQHKSPAQEYPTEQPSATSRRQAPSETGSKLKTDRSDERRLPQQQQQQHPLPTQSGTTSQRLPTNGRSYANDAEQLSAPSRSKIEGGVGTAGEGRYSTQGNESESLKKGVLQHPNQQKQQYEDAFKDLQKASRATPPEAEQVQQQFREVYENTPDVQQIPAESIYIHHNLRVYGQFINNFRNELFSYYQDYAKEYQTKEPYVKCSDIPLVMRVGFYLDNVTFHESKEDKEEMFNKPNAYQKIMAHLEAYLQFVKRVPDLYNQKLSFDDFLDFVAFYLKKDEQVFLRHNDDSEYSAYTKQSNQAVNQTMNNTLEQELRANIERFENQLAEIDSSKERDVIQTIIKNLREQLERLTNVHQQQTLKRATSTRGSKRKTNTSMLSANRTKEERRQRNLGEIFTFYCKQKFVQGAQQTFERIHHESNVMEIGKFNIFCKQFNLLNHHPKLMKREIPVLFKKNSSNYKEMNVHEFKSLLEKIALMMYEGKDVDFPTDLDKVEAFYKYIGLDDPNVFRHKFQILNPPFNIQDKDGFRLLPKDQGRDIKLKSIEAERLEELQKKKIQEKLNYLRILEESRVEPSQKVKRNLSQGNVSMSALSAATMNPLLFNNKSRITYDTYSQRKKKDQEVNTKFNSQVGWQDLESVTFTEMKNLQQGQFRPSDLFDENDDPDDNYYLAEYNLQDDRKQKIIQEVNKYDDARNYGNYKESLRPSQKFLMKNNPTYNLGQRYIQSVHKNHFEDSQQSFLAGKMPQTVKSSISNAYFQRAQQLDKDIDQRERELMQGILQRGQQQVQRGIQASKK